MDSPTFLKPGQYRIKVATQLNRLMAEPFACLDCLPRAFDQRFGAPGNFTVGSCHGYPLSLRVIIPATTRVCQFRPILAGATSHGVGVVRATSPPLALAGQQDALHNRRMAIKKGDNLILSLGGRIAVECVAGNNERYETVPLRRGHTWIIVNVRHIERPVKGTA